MVRVTLTTSRGVNDLYFSFSPFDLRLSWVCVVRDTTCNVFVVVFLGWQSE